MVTQLFSRLMKVLTHAVDEEETNMHTLFPGINSNKRNEVRSRLLNLYLYSHVGKPLGLLKEMREASHKAQKLSKADSSANTVMAINHKQKKNH